VRLGELRKLRELGELGELWELGELVLSNNGHHLFLGYRFL